MAKKKAKAGKGATGRIILRTGEALVVFGVELAQEHFGPRQRIL